MTRTRTAAAGLAAAALVAAACTTGTPTADPAHTTARPVIEQPDMTGQPGRLAADEALRDAVRGFAPWLVQP